MLNESSKTISREEFMNFYRPMTATDSAPPPGAQKSADPYQGYLDVSGDEPVQPNYFLPQAMPPMTQIQNGGAAAMPPLMQIQNGGLSRESSVPIQRSSAPRASRNAPPPAVPGSLPPAGNQQVTSVWQCAEDTISKLHPFLIVV